MHILLESQMTWDKFINRPHYRWWSRHFCDSMRSYHELTRNCWIFLCLFLYIWTLVFEIQDGRAGISFPCLKRPRVFFFVWPVSFYRCWNIISDKDCLYLSVLDTGNRDTRWHAVTSLHCLKRSHVFFCWYDQSTSIVAGALYETSNLVVIFVMAFEVVDII